MTSIREKCSRWIGKARHAATRRYFSLPSVWTKRCLNVTWNGCTSKTSLFFPSGAEPACLWQTASGLKPIYKPVLSSPRLTPLSTGRDKTISMCVCFTSSRWGWSGEKGEQISLAAHKQTCVTLYQNIVYQQKQHVMWLDYMRMLLVSPSKDSCCL